MVGSVLSGIKINGEVDANATSTSSTFVTVYTCPANCYAIVNIAALPGTNDVSVRILNVAATVGCEIIYVSTAWTAPEQYSLRNKHGVYVGPGQSVQVNRPNVGGTAVADVTGVEFINTP